MSVPIGESAPKPLARNIWYGLWVQLLDKLLPIVIFLYLARRLTQAEFGLYSFLLAYLTFFQIAVEYSLDTVLVRQMTADADQRDRILRAGVGLKLLLSVFATLIGCALVLPISGGKVGPFITAYACLTVVCGLGGAYRAYFRSQFEIRSVLVLGIARAVLLGVFIIAVLSTTTDLRAVFGAMAAANLLTFAFAVWLGGAKGGPPVSYDPEIWRSMMRGIWHLSINAFAVTLSLRAGQLLLMSYRGPVDVGMYAAASRVVEGFTLLPEAMMITVYPLFASLHADESPKLIRTAVRSVRFLAVLAGGVSVFCFIAAEPIVSLLFGRDFLAAADTLAVLGFSAVFAAVGSVLLGLLVAAHLEGPLYRVTLAFSLVTVALSVWWIGSYGAVGAAAAVVVSSVGSQIALALLPATREYVRSSVIAGLLVAAIALLAGYAGRAIAENVWLGLACGLFVYALGLFALRIVDREEIDFIRRSFFSSFGKQS